MHLSKGKHGKVNGSQKVFVLTWNLNPSLESLQCARKSLGNLLHGLYRYLLAWPMEPTRAKSSIRMWWILASCPHECASWSGVFQNRIVSKKHQYKNAFMQTRPKNFNQHRNFLKFLFLKSQFLNILSIFSFCLWSQCIFFIHFFQIDVFAIIK